METAEITTTTFVPSPQQQAYFDALESSRRSIIMEAVAGAGKTTTIVRGLDHMSGTVCLVAFNSKMARELRDRVAGRTAGVEAKTFHSAGFSALRKAFPQLRSCEPNEKKVLRICEAFVREKQRRDLEGLEPAVAKIVSMAKQRGIGALCPLTDEWAWHEMIEHFALDDSLPEGQEHMVQQLIKMGQICLQRSNLDLEQIDYDDMVYLPLQRDLRLWPYDNVIVDEAQDTNPTRRALARKMLRPGGRLVAVGDPHQAIYGFTGTDNDSLDQIADEFGCIRMPLTVTYRCPKAVVRVAREFVSHITAHESAPEGEVREYQYADILDRVQLGDAVLCRFNKYLVSLVFRLIRAGVAAKIEGRAIGQGLAKLAGRWKSARTVNQLEQRLEQCRDREVDKAWAKDDERKIEEIRDRHDTMMVLISRAREQNLSLVSELQTMILGLFEDAEKIGDPSKIVTLCSEHRSKGLEWDRVHILGLRGLQPARCSRAWQETQEVNLQYVAVTRAKRELFLVEGVNDDRE
jgi:DNA helicase II / ATP-dependent DNA helicase PcrA